MDLVRSAPAGLPQKPNSMSIPMSREPNDNLGPRGYDRLFRLVLVVHSGLVTVSTCSKCSRDIHGVSDATRITDLQLIVVPLTWRRHLAVQNPPT